MIHLPPLLAASAVFYGIRHLMAARLTTEDAARRAWLAAYPGDTVTRAIPSRDGRSALVETGWGTGVICRRGRIALRLDGADARLDDRGLSIRFHDATAPRVHVDLATADAEDWRDRIQRT